MEFGNFLNYQLTCKMILSFSSMYITSEIVLWFWEIRILHADLSKVLHSVACVFLMSLLSHSPLGLSSSFTCFLTGVFHERKHQFVCWLLVIVLVVMPVFPFKFMLVELLISIDHIKRTSVHRFMLGNAFRSFFTQKMNVRK